MLWLGALANSFQTGLADSFQASQKAGTKRAAFQAGIEIGVVHGFAIETRTARWVFIRAHRLKTLLALAVDRVCSRPTTLPLSVMVTSQILTLLFKVRVLEG